MTGKNKLIEWVEMMNADPNPEHIKQNEDQSFYIPISITQTLLDKIFLGQWSFEVTRETFGRKWARAAGWMECTNPINGEKIRRGGDAGILLTGNIRLDSPRLHSMVLLSCAKKFGRILGRDLNRNKDDAPLPIIKVEKITPNIEQDRLSQLINQCETIEALETFKLLATSKKIEHIYDKKLKDLTEGGMTSKEAIVIAEREAELYNKEKNTKPE